MERQFELAIQPDLSRYTWARFLDDVVERHGDRTALRFEESAWSYRELAREARALARGLAAAGVVKGMRVGLWMANRPEWAIASFAVARVGGVLVPVNTYATDAERDYILRHADVSFLLMAGGLLQRDFPAELCAAHPAIAEGRAGAIHCPALPHLRSAFALGLGESRGGVQPWSDLLADPAADDASADALVDAMEAEVHPVDDGLVIYTSGTTAHPKGVIHYQRAAVIQSWRYVEFLCIEADDVVWTAQPFFWTAGICMSLGATLAAGACLVLEEVFEPARALVAIAEHGATMVHAWPHQEKALAEHADASPATLGSVRKVNFDTPLGAAVGLEKDEWGTHGSYGLSETFTICSGIACDAPAGLRRETSGQAWPGMSVVIVDPETGERLPDGEKGEIAVRGVTLMRGYHKVAPELYLDGEGFFRTQDGGHIDPDGFLHWSGRLSNLIKTGGANVSPLEIERALDQYPGMRTALAVGVPHPVLGEVIVLCAVALPDASLDAQEIRRFLRERLAAYKVPRQVLFFLEEELAFTGSQKVQVAPLREAALSRLCADTSEIEGFVYGAA